ncbi:hypothetical protein C9374_006325 [Naegleria lovaniensis]|uniref:BTB domain-containing protein n=1 Tax=Naegleria lovaniensis TaxID=51637 RepID=A0AA88KMD3_NAELO|nr:uncharacterized protein C9374_006325 [Naegleria lovaniensis]KAG2381336.1 hypothetical protein C9374_006325 [Naegleria lovaniensis]
MFRELFNPYEEEIACLESESCQELLTSNVLLHSELDEQLDDGTSRTPSTSPSRNIVHDLQKNDLESFNCSPIPQSTTALNHSVIDEWIVNNPSEEEALIQLLEFFYTGEITYNIQQALNLLVVAQKYMVQGNLIESIQVELETNIKPSNCFVIFKELLSLNVLLDPFLERVLHTCVSEMSKNLDSILTSNKNELLNFSPSTLITFLKAATKIKYGLRCDGKKLLRLLLIGLWRMSTLEKLSCQKLSHSKPKLITNSNTNRICKTILKITQVFKNH